MVNAWNNIFSWELYTIAYWQSFKTTKVKYYQPPLWGKVMYSLRIWLEMSIFDIWTKKSGRRTVPSSWHLSDYVQGSGLAPDYMYMYVYNIATSMYKNGGSRTHL